MTRTTTTLGVLLIRQSITVFVVLFVLQGRVLITVAILTLGVAFALVVAKWPRRFWVRAFLSLGIVSSSWVIDVFVLRTHMFGRGTDAWDCLVAQTVGLEWRLAGVTGSVHCIADGAPSWHPAREANVADVLRFFDVGILAGILLMALAFCTQRTRTAVLCWWSNAISRAFLTPISGGLARAPLSALRASAGQGAPMPILNCALNVPGSTLAHRGVSRFEMKPYCIGGPLTGWAHVNAYKPELSVGECVGLSAAAVNTQAGAMIPRVIGWLLLVMNFRLGIWLPNPRYPAAPLRWWRGPVAFAEMFKEISGTNTEEDPFVFISDGGHDDNTGIVALCVRSCTTIVAVDAAADRAYTYPDLQATVRQLEAHKWTVLEQKLPDSKDPDLPAGLGYIFLRRPDGERVRIILLKAMLTDYALALMSSNARHYAMTHGAFPQESTADQWFSESQFDAYYAVGQSLAQQLANTELLGAASRRPPPGQSSMS